MRTSSLFGGFLWKVTFVSSFGKKSRPDSHKVEKPDLWPFPAKLFTIWGISCERLLLRVVLRKSLDLIRIKWKKPHLWPFPAKLFTIWGISCERLLLRVVLRKSLDLIRIKWKKKPIFDPFVRTCSLFGGFLVNSYFASRFGEKSRPTSGLLSMLRSDWLSYY